MDVLLLVEVEVPHVVRRGVLLVHHADCPLADALAETRNPDTVLIIKVRDALKVVRLELIEGAELSVVPVGLHALKGVVADQESADVDGAHLARLMLLLL